MKSFYEEQCGGNAFMSYAGSEYPNQFVQSGILGPVVQS